MTLCFDTILLNSKITQHDFTVESFTVARLKNRLTYAFRLTTYYSL